MHKKGVVQVCVTPQPSCRHLIECGHILAEEQNATLKIICVFPIKKSYISDIEALDLLNHCASEFGAEMTVCFSDNPVDRIVQETQNEDVRLFVVGFPGKNSTNFISNLHQKLSTIPFCMVDQNGVTYSIGNPIQKHPDANTTQIIWNAR